jgi:splicing factor 3B subunit 1
MATPMHGIAETPAYVDALDEDGMDEQERRLRGNMARAQQSLPDAESTDDPMPIGRRTIMDNASEYQKRGLMKMTMTPARADPYAMGDQTPDAGVSTYADTLRRAQLNREADNTYRNIELKRREAAEAAEAGGARAVPAAEEPPQKAARTKRRNRWGEQPADATPAPVSMDGDATPAFGLGDATPAHNRWDATPGPAVEETPAYTAAATPAANRWDATPTPGRSLPSATPRRNRWDATPMGQAPGPAEPTPARRNRSRCAPFRLSNSILPPCYCNSA